MNFQFLAIMALLFIAFFALGFWCGWDSMESKLWDKNPKNKNHD